MFKRIIAFIICFSLVFEQAGFAQVAPSTGLPAYLSALNPVADRFRPLHLRSIEFDPAGKFQLLLDQGDLKKLTPRQSEISSRKLFDYFKTGLALPNSMFWVNLRPDAPDSIIDPELEKTDIGKILLQSDVQLKKDLCKFTSPDTSEGRQYWDKLYAKAEELYCGQDIEIPAFTRPWIVPGEIIIRESRQGAFVYKAGLKVMLEQDYLKDSPYFRFDDPRLKEINEYSSELIRTLVIPKLTREVNSSKRYAQLRQVYYSLVLAQWAKARFSKSPGRKDINPKDALFDRIDSKDLSGLTSKKRWAKEAYYKAYQKSFSQGEYRKEDKVKGADGGLTVRQYAAGGLMLDGGASVIVLAGQGSFSAMPGLLSVTVPSENSMATSGVRDGGQGYGNRSLHSMEIVGDQRDKGETRRRHALDTPGKRIYASALALSAVTVAISVLWAQAVFAVSGWAVAPFLALVIFNSVTSSLNSSLLLVNLVHRLLFREKAWEPLPWPEGVEKPVVAVQIACRNEPIDVLQLTIDSALAIDYPPEKLRIQIVDDSSDSQAYNALIEWTSQRIEDLKKKNREPAPVSFIHRDVNTGYKSGALNNAMRQTDASYFGVLDADSVVAADFLNALVPMFLHDPRLAFVHTLIRKTNEGSTLYSRAITVSDDIQREYLLPPRFKHGFPYFHGHNGIVSRAALEAVGGWAEDQPTEDWHMSIMAAMKGWHGAFVPYETWEQAPDTVNKIKTQRRRWAFGTIKDFLDLGRLLLMSELDWNQKLEITLHTYSYAVMLPNYLVRIASPFFILGVVSSHSWMILLHPFSLALIGLSAVSYALTVATIVTYGKQGNRLRDFTRMMIMDPLVALVNTGISFIYARGVIAALRGKDEGFKITPKERTLTESWIEAARKNREILLVGLLQFIPPIAMWAGSLSVTFSFLEIALFCSFLLQVPLLSFPFLEQIGNRLAPADESKVGPVMSDENSEKKKQQHDGGSRLDDFQFRFMQEELARQYAALHRLDIIPEEMADKELAETAILAQQERWRLEDRVLNDEQLLEMLPYLNVLTLAELDFLSQESPISVKDQETEKTSKRETEITESGPLARVLALAALLALCISMAVAPAAAENLSSGLGKLMPGPIDDTHQTITQWQPPQLFLTPDQLNEVMREEPVAERSLTASQQDALARLQESAQKLDALALAMDGDLNGALDEWEAARQEEYDTRRAWAVELSSRPRAFEAYQRGAIEFSFPEDKNLSVAYSNHVAARQRLSAAEERLKRTGPAEALENFGKTGGEKKSLTELTQEAGDSPAQQTETGFTESEVKGILEAKKEYLAALSALMQDPGTLAYLAEPGNWADLVPEAAPSLGLGNDIIGVAAQDDEAGSEKIYSRRQIAQSAATKIVVRACEETYSSRIWFSVEGMPADSEQLARRVDPAVAEIVLSDTDPVPASVLYAAQSGLYITLGDTGSPDVYSRLIEQDGAKVLVINEAQELRENNEDFVAGQIARWAVQELGGVDELYAFDKEHRVENRFSTDLDARQTEAIYRKHIGTIPLRYPDPQIQEYLRTMLIINPEIADYFISENISVEQVTSLPRNASGTFFYSDMGPGEIKIVYPESFIHETFHAYDLRHFNGSPPEGFAREHYRAFGGIPRIENGAYSYREYYGIMEGTLESRGFDFNSLTTEEIEELAGMRDAGNRDFSFGFQAEQDRAIERIINSYYDLDFSQEQMSLLTADALLGSLFAVNLYFFVSIYRILELRRIEHGDGEGPAAQANTNRSDRDGGKGAGRGNQIEIKSELYTRPGRLDHILSAIQQLAKEIPGVAVIYDFGVGMNIAGPENGRLLTAGPVTTLELDGALKGTAQIYGIDPFIDSYYLDMADSQFVFNKDWDLIWGRYLDRNRYRTASGSAIPDRYREQADETLSKLRPQLQSRGVREYTEGGNTLVAAPIRRFESESLHFIEGDVFDMGATDAAGAIPPADIVRVANVIIPHYELRSIERALRSLLPMVKQGGYVFIGYEYDGEEYLVYRKTDNTFILEKYAFSVGEETVIGGQSGNKFALMTDKEIKWALRHAIEEWSRENGREKGITDIGDAIEALKDYGFQAEKLGTLVTIRFSAEKELPGNASGKNPFGMYHMLDFREQLAGEKYGIPLEVRTEDSVRESGRQDGGKDLPETFNVGDLHGIAASAEVMDSSLLIIELEGRLIDLEESERLEDQQIVEEYSEAFNSGLIPEAWGREDSEFNRAWGKNGSPFVYDMSTEDLMQERDKFEAVARELMRKKWVLIRQVWDLAKNAEFGEGFVFLDVPLESCTFADLLVLKEEFERQRLQEGVWTLTHAKLNGFWERYFKESRYGFMRAIGEGKGQSELSGLLKFSLMGVLMAAIVAAIVPASAFSTGTDNISHGFDDAYPNPFIGIDHHSDASVISGMDQMALAEKYNLTELVRKRDAFSLALERYKQKYGVEYRGLDSYEESGEADFLQINEIEQEYTTAIYSAHISGTLDPYLISEDYDQALFLPAYAGYYYKTDEIVEELSEMREESFGVMQEYGPAHVNYDMVHSHMNASQTAQIYKEVDGYGYEPQELEDAMLALSLVNPELVKEAMDEHVTFEIHSAGTNYRQLPFSGRFIIVHPANLKDRNSFVGSLSHELTHSHQDEFDPKNPLFFLINANSRIFNDGEEEAYRISGRDGEVLDAIWTDATDIRTLTFEQIQSIVAKRDAINSRPWSAEEELMFHHFMYALNHHYYYQHAIGYFVGVVVNDFIAVAGTGLALNFIRKKISQVRSFKIDTIEDKYREVSKEATEEKDNDPGRMVDGKKSVEENRGDGGSRQMRDFEVLDERQQDGGEDLPETFNVGDLHGIAASAELILKRAIQAANEGRKFEAVFHGDMFDRGTESREVFEILKQLKKIADSNPGNITMRFALGNHEVLMLQAVLLGDPESFRIWQDNGGRETFRSFYGIGQEVPAEPDIYARLVRDTMRELALWVLNNTVLFYIDSRNFLHVHAGIPTDGRGNPSITRNELESLQKELERVQRAVSENDLRWQGRLENFLRAVDGRDGLLWIREPHWLEKIGDDPEKLNNLLSGLGVAGIVFGHDTVVRPINVGNRVFGVDVVDKEGTLIFDEKGRISFHSSEGDEVIKSADGDETLDDVNAAEAARPSYEEIMGFFKREFGKDGWDTLVKFLDAYKGLSGREQQGYHSFEHGLEVSFFAYMAGKKRGYSRPELLRLTVAATLHDFDVREANTSPSVARTLAALRTYPGLIRAMAVLGVDPDAVSLLIERTDYPWTEEKQAAFREKVGEYPGNKEILQEQAELLQVIDKAATYSFLDAEVAWKRTQALHAEWGSTMPDPDKAIDAIKFLNTVEADPSFTSVFGDLPSWARDNWERGGKELQKKASEEKDGGKNLSDRAEDPAVREKQNNDLAGIDFRSLPLPGAWAQAPVVMPRVLPEMRKLAENSKINDLDAEWKDIEDRMRAEKSMPYSRIKEYISVCATRPDARKHLDKTVSCILSILRMEEEQALPTSRELKELLVYIG